MENNSLKLKTVEFCILTLGTLYVWYNFNVFPPDFFAQWRPISFYKLFSEPFSRDFLFILKSCWIFFLIFAGLGIGGRLFRIVGALCAIVLLGHHYNFGNVYHGTHVYIGAVIILCLLPRPKSNGLLISYIKYFVVFVMVLTGLQKLYYGGGLDWAFTDAFFVRLASHPYQAKIGRAVLEGPLILSQIFAGWALIVAELLAFMALFHKNLGRAYFFIWSSFHLGVTLVFGNHFMFYSQIFVYSAFLDLEFAFLLTIKERLEDLFPRPNKA
ncbi:MAG: hypothetical protein K9K67_08405 [Bacteriovoracaceae bacterium]|nr:hypothetical protein [Bacteriovoracaceae bacterium]